MPLHQEALTPVFQVVLECRLYHVLSLVFWVPHAHSLVRTVCAWPIGFGIHGVKQTRWGWFKIQGDVNLFETEPRGLSLVILFIRWSFWPLWDGWRPAAGHALLALLMYHCRAIHLALGKSDLAQVRGAGWGVGGVPIGRRDSGWGVSSHTGTSGESAPCLHPHWCSFFLARERGLGVLWILHLSSFSICRPDSEGFPSCHIWSSLRLFLKVESMSQVASR